jgi:hypothetical protein
LQDETKGEKARGPIHLVWSLHYIDETEARVRGMVYSGAWPRQLPPNDRLFEHK